MIEVSRSREEAKLTFAVKTVIWCYVICKSDLCSMLRVCRISVKGRRFPSTVISFSSAKKSILRRSLRPSISKGSHCWERRPVWNKYSILSRRSTTAQSFRKCPFLPSQRKHIFKCWVILYRPECCIICLIYINRLIAFTEIPLQPTNWRPLVLCSLLVAQKVWDDRYLSNSDFAFIYPFFMTE